MSIVYDSGAVRIIKLELGPWPTNAYIVMHLLYGECALVDAPAGPERILQSIEGSRLKYILMTHGHRDHTGALLDMKAAGALVCAHAGDAGSLPCPPDVLLDDGDLMKVGGIELSVFHTPGHTPGSVCFRFENVMLCGDTIFPGGPGHTNSPANFVQVLDSIQKKILVLPDDTQLFPGHGLSATVGEARVEVAHFKSRMHAPGLCGDVVWRS